MLAILFALVVLPVAEVALSPADLARAAAGIRAYGHPCARITRVTQVARDVYRVACGREVYRVRYGRGVPSIGRW